MQRSYRCPCSFRALETFIRNVAGLDIRQRRKNISFRSLTTRSALHARQFSSRPFVSQSNATIRFSDDAFVPFESDASEKSTSSRGVASLGELPETSEPLDTNQEPGNETEFEPDIVIHEELAHTDSDPTVRDARLRQFDLKDRDQAVDATFWPELQAQPQNSTTKTYPGKNARKKARRAAQAQGQQINSPDGVAQDGGKPSKPSKPVSQARLDRKARRAAQALAAVSEQDQEAADVALLIASATGPKPISPAKAEKIALATKARKAEEKAAKKAAAEKLIQEQAAAKEAQKERNRTKERWQVQKAALQEKFGEQGYNPRKRISPDALAGIRALHAKSPETFSTPVLAEHFKVPPEAIRRILKSKWQPSEEEAEERRERWEKRGEKKWSEMAEQGIKPPKKWRDRGVGKAAPGELPVWKQAGKGGERWIESTDADRFVIAGEQVAEEEHQEHQDDGIASRIL